MPCAEARAIEEPDAGKLHVRVCAGAPGNRRPYRGGAVATEEGRTFVYIDDFIWLPDILEKLASKHHVTQDEVEEVFFNQPRYRFVEPGHTPSEDVYAASGQTDAGRSLNSIFYSQIGQYSADLECARYGPERKETL
jgi:hypothetical protein